MSASTPTSLSQSPLETGQNDRIDVIVPVRTEFASTVRTVAASLGADAGFSIDEIDDFRLGLSEVFAAFAESPEASEGRLRVSFHAADGRLTASAALENGASEVHFDDLAAGILRSVVDEFTSGSDGVRIVKQALELGQRGPGAAAAE
jgi:hypothetical protein